MGLSAITSVAAPVTYVGKVAINGNGRLSDGSTTNRTSPVKIVDGNVSAIAAGYNHSLYRKSDVSLWGMGNNFSGQLNKLSILNSREALQAVFQLSD